MNYSIKYTVFIIISTLITYISGLLIEKADGIKDKNKSLSSKKLWVFLSFASNLGILFSFKYISFFNNILKDLFSKFNLSYNAPEFNLIVPLGISFYTLQALSYTVDVYRKDVKAQKSLQICSVCIFLSPSSIRPYWEGKAFTESI